MVDWWLHPLYCWCINTVAAVVVVVVCYWPCSLHPVEFPLCVKSDERVKLDLNFL